MSWFSVASVALAKVPGATPLGVRTCLLANPFDSNGDFSFTNMVNLQSGQILSPFTNTLNRQGMNLSHHTARGTNIDQPGAI